LSRSTTAFADKDRHADTNGAHITGGARGTAALKGHPSTTLLRTKIIASDAPALQAIGRDVTNAKRRIANGVVSAKSLVYLSLFGLVSVVALIYKYLLLAMTGVMARLYPAEFDRDMVVEALNEIEKDSRLSD
jgi:hypothetical protein